MKTSNQQTLSRAVQNVLLLSLSAVFFVACSSENGGVVNTSAQEPKPFKTSEEAVLQGKKDLVELLRARGDLNLGVDPAQVERSQPEAALTSFEVDFGKLLQADITSGLEQISSAKGNITPLSTDNQVVGIIETRQDTDGWRVSGLSNQTVKQDLIEMRRSNADRTKGKISYFEVPNIQARVYSVVEGNRADFFTNYEGFSFEKPVSLNELLPRLKEDAAAFQKQYGEALKKGNLVR